MHRIPLLISSLALAMLATSARAQVSVDLRALDALPHDVPAPAAPPAPAPRRPHPAPRRPSPAPLAETRKSLPAHVAAPARAPEPVPARTAVAAPAAPLPSLPQAAPPAPAGLTAPPAPAGLTAPPAPAGLTAPPAPAGLTAPPAPAGLTAPPAPAGLTGAPPSPTPATLTLPFRPDQAFLTPDEIRAIGRLVRSAPQTEGTSYSVLAYAPASPQNPSATRRLALARALAVHDALRAAGVPGTRILVRAVGAPSGPDNADRAVLTMSLPGTNR